MKKFTIPCFFGDQRIPFALYVGSPSDEFHPMQFQQQWLSNERGGYIPAEVMESFKKLHDISKENKVDFEELCMYALGSAAKEKKDEQEGKDDKNKEG